MTHTLRVTFVAIAAAWCVVCAPPQPAHAAHRGRSDDHAARALARRFDAMRRAQRIPGLAVVVLRDTMVVLARGFGYANVAHRTPVTPETPFNIASVTKPISAVVALKLVEAGVLDLDKPMREYHDFSEFCADARGAMGQFFGDFRCDDERLTLRRVLSMSANGEPGTRFLYNPPSYSWASRPMMEVTGRAFSSLVDSLVLRPALMRHAARRHRRLELPADIAAALATPYHTDSAGRVVESDPPPAQGDGAAGGVIASAMDLARFDAALMEGRLITPASRAALWEPTRTPAGEALPYGLGWFLGELGGRRVAWHTGLWDGAYSALYLKVLSDAREERLTLILLANTDALKWESELDEAAVERSEWAREFLRAFGGR